MALMRQMAISGPILNCMNIMATRPPTVVRQLDEISGMLLDSASMTDSFNGRVSCSSRKWLEKMMA